MKMKLVSGDFVMFADGSIFQLKSYL